MLDSVQSKSPSWKDNFLFILGEYEFFPINVGRSPYFVAKTYADGKFCVDKNVGISTSGEVTPDEKPIC